MTATNDQNLCQCLQKQGGILKLEVIILSKILTAAWPPLPVTFLLNMVILDNLITYILLHKTAETLDPCYIGTLKYISTGNYCM